MTQDRDNCGAVSLKVCFCFAYIMQLHNNMQYKSVNTFFQHLRRLFSS